MGLFDEVLDNVGEEHKSSKGFTYGTHEVVIGTAKAEADAKGREVIKVTVFDEADNDKQATCTLWFHSEGGAKMAVTKVLGLLVHKVGEEKKEAVRTLGKQLFASITDTTKARDVAVKLINDKLIGAKAFLVAEPTGKYTTTSYGDIWHYAAKPEGEAEGEAEDEAQATAQDVGGAVDDTANLPDFDGDEL